MIEDFTHKADKPFHSSGYAEVAHGVSIGATSKETFRQRYELDRNRRYVQRYHASQLANASVRRLPQLSENADSGSRRGYSASKPIVIPPRAQPGHFSEPTGRGYNPYA